MADLAAPAILECLTAAEPIPTRDIPVLLGVAPPDRPFRFPGLDDQILGEIEDRLGFRLHPGVPGHSPGSRFRGGGTPRGRRI